MAAVVTRNALQAQRSQYQQEMAEMTVRAETAEGKITRLRPRLIYARERHEESLEALEDAYERAEIVENERNKAHTELAKNKEQLVAATAAATAAVTLASV